MVDVPADKITQEQLIAWYNLSAELKTLKWQESTQRKRIFDLLFPEPREGTNQFHDDNLLMAGYVLKAVYALTRDVDLPALLATQQEFLHAGINLDKLFKWEPKLVKGEYNKLTEEQAKLIDAVLIVKPGSPQLSIEKEKALKKGPKGKRKSKKDINLEPLKPAVTITGQTDVQAVESTIMENISKFNSSEDDDEDNG